MGLCKVSKELMASLTVGSLLSNMIFDTWAGHEDDYDCSEKRADTC